MAAMTPRKANQDTITKPVENRILNDKTVKIEKKIKPKMKTPTLICHSPNSSRFLSGFGCFTDVESIIRCHAVAENAIWDSAVIASRGDDK